MERYLYNHFILTVCPLVGEACGIHGTEYNCIPGLMERPDRWPSRDSNQTSSQYRYRQTKLWKEEKFFFSTPWVHVGGAEEWLHLFLISTLDW